MFKLLRTISEKLKLDITFLKEMRCYFNIICRHNGSSRTMSNPDKLLSLIMRECHVLEKGMSLPDPHFPFGAERACSLIKLLKEYVKIPGYDKETASSVTATIRSYIDYNETHGAALPEVVRLLNSLPESVLNARHDTGTGGVIEVDTISIVAESKNDFEHLLKSRHSHRDFSNAPVPVDLIEKALQLASCTPSACNRQAWRTHVFSGQEAHDILDWQGGCRGFSDKIRTIVVVTSNLNAFFAHEPMQAYIDGGMYAMNLINSLHYEGLGTIPLSCGFPLTKLRKLHDHGIPEQEIPILIVGIGIMPEKTKVAKSTRLDYSKTNTFHE